MKDSSLETAAIQMGGCGFWNGRGMRCTSSSCQNLPFALTLSSVQSRRIMPIASSKRSRLSDIGTPYTSNSFGRKARHAVHLELLRQEGPPEPGIQAALAHVIEHGEIAAEMR